MKRLLIFILLLASASFAGAATTKTTPYDVVVPTLSGTPSPILAGQLYFDLSTNNFMGIDSSGSARTFATTPQWINSGSDLYYSSGAISIGSAPPSVIDGLTVTIPDDGGNAFLIRAGTTGTKGAVIIKPEFSTDTANIQGTNSSLSQTNTLSLQAEGGDLDLGNGSFQTRMNGAIQMSAFGAGTCTFDSSGNVSSSSDERLKTDIRPFRTGLSALKQIVPIRYKWNEISGMETRNEYIGFSAQNIQSALPGGVGVNPKGILVTSRASNYRNLSKFCKRITVGDQSNEGRT